jgi:hypothetical protein
MEISVLIENLQETSKYEAAVVTTQPQHSVHSNWIL